MTMLSAAERTRPRHPIRVVARRTGLTPAVIRAWENRYQAVTPERGNGGQRLYSDDDIARLILLRKATDAGRRISHVAGLSDVLLARIVAEDDTSKPPEPRTLDDRIDACVEMLAGLGHREVAQVLGQLAPHFGARRLRAEVLEPTLDALGGRLHEVHETDEPLVTRQWILSRDALVSPALSGTPRGPDGGLLLPDLDSVRQTVHRLNRERQAERRLSTGQLHALLLIQELVAQVIGAQQGQGGVPLLASASTWLAGRFGRERLDRTLESFRRCFGAGPIPVEPPRTGGDGDAGQGATARPRQLLMLLFLWLANRNPAFDRLRDLFDDHRFEEVTGYHTMIASLDDYFAEDLGPDFRLISSLRRPLDRATGVDRQLQQLIERTRPPAEMIDRLHRGLDVLREEAHLPFAPPVGPAPPPQPPPPEVPPSEWRPAVESPWMERAVIVAKNTLVWLDHLRRDYHGDIHRLDHIPTEALEELRTRGFDALWLVGLWQRSKASETLKRRSGMRDAAASAYALDAYEIAEELGGQAAFERLEARCQRVGLRIACDMVPNHTGLDARWVLEHPERFVSVAEPPFPDYRYTGGDLPPVPELGLWLEDGYADRTEAAVVFKRLDRRTGEVRYLYHGNDGTGLPWNDTAQLDYTRPEVREAVIEQILTITRRFPIVRFDAAMTLTRQHFQRLWYPAPGSGGAIPSRAEHGLTPEAFDHRMPRELWLDVVDRVADEAPDTLLVAEAFWLMEPYFIRRLGFHRVYHSVFLHAVRDERNEELQRWLRDALATEPAELRRYVNFLTTPDERPAAEAFGKGDKYFAAATLLVTLPGTPLFGHGQAEGMLEKYGMEYRRGYFSEGPDPVFL
ncbi:MAG: MerR family transcriptional regulator, partial [Holophagales bacterium]|nr:MerR family transcriptional regulator [Holophagales bacterium]